MESTIQFRFKSEKNLSSISFVGRSLSLNDLKRAIANKIKIHSREIDLQITDAATGVQYNTADAIPTNASVIVARVPLSLLQPYNDFAVDDERKLKTKKGSHTQDLTYTHQTILPQDASEEDKIAWIATQSLAAAQPRQTQAGVHRGTATRMCFYCHERGHLIIDCPKRKARTRHASMRAHERWVRMHAGHASPSPSSSSSSSDSGADSTADIDPALLCSLCHKVQREAVSLACCNQSFCDTCIRGHLLGALFEGDTPQCPNCHQSEVLPDHLSPNHQLRTVITALPRRAAVASASP